MQVSKRADEWRAEALEHYAAQRWDDAAAAFEQLLALDPEDNDAWYRLGNTRQEQGREQAALACFERVLAAEPRRAQAWNNLGTCREKLGEAAAAAAAYQRAIDEDPALLPALVNLANLRLRLGDYAEASGLFERAAALDPAIRAELDRRTAAAKPYLERVRLAGTRGDRAALEDALAAALQHLPGNPTLQHLLAAARGETHAQPSTSYVKALFDEFAERYDSQMIGALDYQAPGMIAETVLAMLRQCPQPRIVDLGCGTGFMAAALAGAKPEMLGIDLSQKMLDRAAQRGGYAQLVRGDLVQELQRVPAGWAHAIVAADVFVYLGDLQPVYAAAARALAPRGVFSFTVEALEDGNEYRLNLNGRYAHSSAYLRALGTANGLEERRMERIHPRREADRAVEGWLMCFVKQGDGEPG
jgi:predicted TPR repeat methyltransferase